MIKSDVRFMQNPLKANAGELFVQGLSFTNHNFTKVEEPPDDSSHLCRPYIWGSIV